MAVGGVIAVTTAVLALASVFVRRRTASAELRQQWPPAYVARA